MHYTFVNNVSLLPLQEQMAPKLHAFYNDVTPGTYAIEFEHYSYHTQLNEFH